MLTSVITCALAHLLSRSFCRRYCPIVLCSQGIHFMRLRFKTANTKLVIGDNALNPSCSRFVRCSYLLSRLSVQTLFSRKFLQGSVLARQCCSAWLLAIMRLAGSHPTVQNRLLDIQTAFSVLLGEDKQFTQECASKGETIKE